MPREPVHRFQLNIPIMLWLRLRTLARKNHRSVTAQLVHLIEQAVEWEESDESAKSP